MSATKAFPVQHLSLVQFFILVSAFLVVCMALPTPAQASGLSDSQIRAVIGLLQSFNVDSETVGAIDAQLHDAVVAGSTGGPNHGGPGEHGWQSGGSGPGTATSTKPHDDNDGHDRPTFPGASACGQLMHNLNRGDQGDEVTHLQEHLRMTGDFDYATSTGYFGDKTQEALKRLQAREGIVNGGDPGTTGFGSVGPKTRQLLMDRCKGDSNGGSTSTTSCPLYQIPICATGQHVENGPYGTNSCKGAPRCVPGTVSCPVYSACPVGYTANISTAPNGCVVQKCVAPTATSTWPQIPKDNVGTDDPNKPMCTLTASRGTIALGEAVTLNWESKNATWASNGVGGAGPTNGSVTLTPTQTTTYLKLVYNTTSASSTIQGHCSTTVEVAGTVPTTTQKVVEATPTIDFGQIISLMGSGMASVFDGYLSLLSFNL